LAQIKEIDIDHDGIPDGQDIGPGGKPDGKLNSKDDDVCYHGQLADGTCVGSSSVQSSPYFAPLCQSLEYALTQLQLFHDFAVNNISQTKGDTNKFINEADANLWGDKAANVQYAIDSLSSSISHANNSTWDPFLVQLGRYSSYLKEVVGSLYQDQDLVLDSPWGDEEGATGVIRMTKNMLDYVTQVKAAIGKCDNPDPSTIPNIPPPDFGNGGSTAVTCAENPNGLACNVPNNIDLVNQVRSYVVNTLDIDIGPNCGAEEIIKRVAWVLRDKQAGLLNTFHSSRCDTNSISADFMSFPDGSGVDIMHLGGTTATTTASWIAYPSGQFEANTSYVAPTDPGDPADACYITSTCP